MFSVDVMAGFYAGRRRQVNAQLAPSQTSALWFFLCLTGTPGNIANTTHVVGLVLGTTWGFFSSLRAQLGL